LLSRGPLNGLVARGRVQRRREQRLQLRNAPTRVRETPLKAVARGRTSGLARLVGRRRLGRHSGSLGASRGHTVRFSGTCTTIHRIKKEHHQPRHG